MENAAAPTPGSSMQLAVDRTRLAHDRTLMAWVRTATSLISFGFTIYKFFQTMKEQGQTGGDRLFGPREFALFMIGTGLTALALATIQHRSEMQKLRKQYREVPYSLATVLAGLVTILGIIAFVAVVFKQ